MLPVPTVARRAARLARAHGASTVWFGAAAPLALLGPYLRRHAGIRRVVASTHGHEVGWSMLPLARQALGRIGRDADVVTVVSLATRAAASPRRSVRTPPSSCCLPGWTPRCSGPIRRLGPRCDGATASATRRW